MRSVSGPLGLAEVSNIVAASVIAHYEFFIFLNQDTISVGSWIEDCVAALSNVSAIGAVSPWILDYQGFNSHAAALECAGSFSGVRERPSGLLSVSVVPAAALVCRCDVLLAVGPFDPVYGSYYEDFDSCDRIRRFGREVMFLGSAAVRHYSGSATKTESAVRHRRRLVSRNRAVLRIGRSKSRIVRTLFELWWGLPIACGRAPILVMNPFLVNVAAEMYPRTY